MYSRSVTICCGKYKGFEYWLDSKLLKLWISFLIYKTVIMIPSFQILVEVKLDYTWCKVSPHFTLMAIQILAPSHPPLHDSSLFKGLLSKIVSCPSFPPSLKYVKMKMMMESINYIVLSFRANSEECRSW